ncbi:DUF2267 domain-containing protein [Melissospora conviva]|uniref:DUF2267 domain-containing protein n=1 Tax=Melissospora conviva TaxID=3388432 RepID=UPI003B777987
MDYDTFISEVSRRAHVDSEVAVALTRATLATLQERLTGGEALDLAAQLPLPLQTLMSPRPQDERAEHVDRSEFVGRVAERAQVHAHTAQSGVRAVFVTMRDAITGEEFDDVVVQFPEDYRDLVEPAMAPRESYLD